MTPHTNEIKQLIVEIDQLLSQSSKGLSKFLSNQGQQEKEILQRVRELLSKLDEEQISQNQVLQEIPNQSVKTGLSALITQFKENSNVDSASQSFLLEQEATSIQTLQIQEQLNFVLQPLQAELSKLLAERASLIQEIRQLEQKRLQNYSLSQQLANQDQIIAEFLEVLMGRLVPHFKSYTSITTNPDQKNLEAVTSAIAPILESADKIEQLTNFARNLDQRLLALDGTVNIVFEALERNINTYYESLSQALAKMHNQGMQGEQLMANFLNNLTQYLQQQVLVNEPVLSSVNVRAIPSSLLEESNNLATGNKPLVAPGSIIEATNTENVLPESQSLESQPLDIEPITLYTELLAQPPQSEEYQPAQSTDEVDELYASFFNANTEISVPINLSLLDETIISKDISLSSNSEILNNDLLITEINEKTVTNINEIITDTQLNDLPVTINNSLETQAPNQLEPIQTDENSGDIITVLTDLLIDTVDEQVPLESLQNQLDNYIPAQAEENLRSLVDNDSPAIPGIVLDTQQLQQLDQDLANFDQPLNSLPLPTPELKTETQTDNITIVTSPETDSSSTTPTYIEAKKETFSQSPVTNQQSPITASQVSIPHDGNNDLVDRHHVDPTWYLGIDIGTTGISAALLNRSKLVIYPIYWSAEQQDGSSTFQQSFHLPAEVYLPNNSASNQGKNSGEAAVPHICSAQLKPFLQIAVPYQQERQKWEPMLQLNEFCAGPLIWVVRSLSKLLLTLRSSQTSTTPALIANALGMNHANFSTVIKNISGVICSCPSNWTEQYRFNIREAIITSKLVSHAQQIFFVEEAIASLLPELDTFNGQPVNITNNENLQILKTSDYPLLGNTLAINIGAIATEMSLVDIPANLDELTHNHFMLHNFAYAGKGMEQDIICQLLLPPKSRQTLQPGESNNQSANTNPWNWQPSIPGLDQMQFSSLGLETLTLPKVGEPDTQARIIFQQRLESSLLGQALLDAALALKLILQHQESFTLELADQRWVLQRRDLESQVFVPFVRRLNRELNKLLVARGIPTEAINQAILSGGVASVGTINRWLRQKLPNAKIIQDSYLGENGAPNCSRVALGLAMLPLHPQILDISRQQYTDYFLFSELLKILPNRTLSFGEVLQLFESRGINTRNCQQRLLAFLEGELPSGLIPAPSDSLWLTHHSQENPDYITIASLKPGNSPLVEKQGNLSYRPNYQQVQFLLRYLDTIKSSTVQSLDEPYTYLLQSQV
ncbi:hypothetical protein [Cuspidothrix issatschenkoi]|uniref:Uncharacterized protein n=1 Tax=Cuspidothrix issatschenkoi CHARLIE-1 TaxID=2052836 RepID=A0A2S6CWG3_9CYAN|nr:hypothetical protein [Cuspidothrix issatschenkoi]PPJ64098.1 hypothetical protein CUN59_06435 [Cuspidothrix issatschenkoi CHARLIE-1]